MLADKLYDYQTVAVNFCFEREGSAVFCEQGTGKTYITAGLIEKILHPTFLGLLIVPLANIETTWVRTLKLVKGVKVLRTWEGYKKYKGTRPIILLLHYEGVRKLIKKMRKVPWDLIVYDESQRLKGRGSKQSRDANRFVYGHRRVVLSGTPIEQSPQDLWGQFRFALPEVFGTRFEDFKDEWLKETGYMGYKLKFRFEKLPQFLKLIEPHIHRVRKDEVLDLPPLTYHHVKVDLLGEQRRVYESLRDESTCDVAGGTVTCDMEITKLIRLQQVTGGFIRLDPTEDERRLADEQDRRPKGRIVHVGRAKLRKLRAILRRVERPVVIFCKQRHELAQIVKSCEGERVGIISGKTKKTRTQTVEAFQRGEIDILACQIKAGGVGLDLQVACTCIIYSATFSFIDFDQGVCRLHRNGQSKPVRVFLISANNTVDTDIYEALLSKRKVTETVLRRKPMGKPEKKKAPAAAAKKTETAPAKKEEAAPAKKEEPTFKYGVKELAEALGIKAASVRVRLRSAKVAKAGKSYGWNTKTELQAVIDQIKSEKKAKAAEDDADESDDTDEEEAEEESEEEEE